MNTKIKVSSFNLQFVLLRPCDQRLFCYSATGFHSTSLFSSSLTCLCRKSFILCILSRCCSSGSSQALNSPVETNRKTRHQDTGEQGSDTWRRASGPVCSRTARGGICLRARGFERRVGLEKKNKTHEWYREQSGGLTVRWAKGTWQVTLFLGKMLLNAPLHLCWLIVFMWLLRRNKPGKTPRARLRSNF